MTGIQLADRKDLETFLKHRQLKDAITERLRKIKERNDLKPSDLKAASNLSYEDIVKSIDDALNNGWMTLDELTDLLDQGETSGRQHVCVFQVPDVLAKTFAVDLLAPEFLATDKPDLAEFLSVPSTTSARILSSPPAVRMVKIVSERTYWYSNVLNDEPEYQLVERFIERERSATILRYDENSKLLQIRVPPREKGPPQTAKAVFDYAICLLESVYPIQHKTWLQQLCDVKIGGHFNLILKNITDFELSHDTPTDRKTKASLSTVGRAKPGSDLRNTNAWTVFGKNYARDTIRGFWKAPNGNHVYVHMNADRVRQKDGSIRDVSRVFFPQCCSEHDMNHVIKRIREHV